MTVHFETVENSTEVGYKVGSDTPSHSEGFYSAFAKRGLDLVVVIAAAPILVPLSILVAALIGVSGNSPLFVQKRVGRGGRVFRMWKFRTMVSDAERVLTEYLKTNPDARAEWDAHQKLKNDPRITVVGRVLRKTSLDELPQFWNVLRGQMSIVGPRPMMVDQQIMYPGDSYYRMRPGITGLWQISDRNACAFRERAYYDSEYERILSFSTDLQILRRTVGVVLRGTGY